MPQLSLYIDDVMMGKMRNATTAEGLSLSRYAAEAIRERLESSKRITDEARWDTLYGCLAEEDSFVRPESLPTHSITALDVVAR